MNLEKFLSVMLNTPLPDPSEHPRDPQVIWGVPINMVGLSGVGKSARIKKVGKACGLPTHVVFAATKQRDEFGSVYVANGEGGINLECVLPAARKCMDVGHGLIFFDEISCVPRSVHTALLSVVNDRQIGDHILPPKTRILLAMNPPEAAVNGLPLPPPMANRMGHVKYENPSKEDWTKWLFGMEPDVINVEEGEKRVIANWDDHFPMVKGLAAGFMQRVSEEMLHNQPPSDNPNSSAAWPSPRMWYWALCGITAARCLNTGAEIEQDIVLSLCGDAAATQWYTWNQEADLPHPLDMITKGWTPNKQRLDRTMAALSAMTEFVVRKERADALAHAMGAWRVLIAAVKVGHGDIAATFIGKMIKANLGRKDTPKGVADAATEALNLIADKGLVQLAV